MNKTHSFVFRFITCFIKSRELVLMFSHYIYIVLTVHYKNSIRVNHNFMNYNLQLCPELALNSILFMCIM